MREQIKQFERELEMAVNNVFVLHDCGASQQELEKQNQRVVLLETIVKNMKDYEEIREEPKGEEQFFRELEEELAYEEKILQNF